MNPYENLANAIIILAVKDYRTVLCRCIRFPNDKENCSERQSLERFFQSGWFGVLTNLDGEVLMVSIRREVFGKAVVA